MSTVSSSSSSSSSSSLQVGVVVVGHGATANSLREAAELILGRGMPDILFVDAQQGRTDDLKERMCDAIVQADVGKGVLLAVDLLGASPCACGQQEGRGHEIAVVSGINLAMVLKLANLKRDGLSPQQMALACADSGKRAITIVGEDSVS